MNQRDESRGRIILKEQTQTQVLDCSLKEGALCLFFYFRQQQTGGKRTVWHLHIFEVILKKQDSLFFSAAVREQRGLAFACRAYRPIKRIKQKILIFEMCLLSTSLALESELQVSTNKFG